MLRSEGELARSNNAQYLIKHEFVKRLHKRYDQEGITIPFPIRTVYLRSEETAGEASPSARVAQRVDQPEGSDLRHG